MTCGMVQPIALKIRQERMNGGRVGLVESAGLTQASFAAAALTCQQMAQKRSFMFHTATFGELKTFSGAAR
jgi:hypothetical protein